MDKTDEVIDKFMHPTVFTGVKPLFLVAEELATKEHMGDIIDAVWVDWDEDAKDEFSYINKLAVRGKIIERNYYTAEEKEPFKGRLALPDRENLEKMALHRAIKQEIDEVKAKRYALSNSIEKDLDVLAQILSVGKEVSLFKKGSGDWRDPFNEIDIDAPYELVESSLDDGEYMLKHPKTGVIEKYDIKNEFYAYVVGAKADIAGLKLKDESYKKTIESLKDEERSVLASIEWLELKDPRLQSIKDKLPRHPFEDYFNYVKKGSERELHPPENLIKAIELIVAEYMPKLNGPMGVEYIPIDNLLHLFHEVIPRADALLALEGCDIIHEPSAVVLGIEGKRELPPKFLVSIYHVADAYKKFPQFVEACERYLSEE